VDIYFYAAPIADRIVLSFESRKFLTVFVMLF